MKLSELRKLLPDVQVENHPYCIGYWMRWAGQECGLNWKDEMIEGWNNAHADIEGERASGSIVVGTYSRIEDRAWYIKQAQREIGKARKVLEMYGATA